MSDLQAIADRFEIEALRDNYGDFQEPLPKLVHALNRGWFYEGQHKPTFGKPHGTKAAHLPGRNFVVCAQNHDQIGNRASGERLTALGCAKAQGWNYGKPLSIADTRRMLAARGLLHTGTTDPDLPDLTTRRQVG